MTQAAATPNSGSTPAAWTQSFQYDGFGNLTARVLNGTTTTIGVTAATNRLSSSSYDANGNMTSGAGASFTYDEMNRLSKAAPTSGGEEHYAYSPDNRRIHTINPYGGERFTLYGAHGEKIGIYYLNFQGHIEQTEADIWFGGRLIWQGPPAIGGAVLEDRVGTGDTTLARPYGENSGHFATYSQDSLTTLHYADQRYYASAYGRFTSVDPRGGNGNDPTTLNRYAYVGGDPVNQNDPLGLCAVMIAGITMGPDANTDWAKKATQLGADVAYPYSGEGFPGSVGSVIQQGQGTANDSTAAALKAIQYALSTNTGLIDIVAYSGGAGAFTAAYNELTADQQARIGLVQYISPGSNGQLANVQGTTSVLLGGGYLDNFATDLGTEIPQGVPIQNSSCDHRDLACLFKFAPLMSGIAANGDCQNPEVFSRTGPPVTLKTLQSILGDPVFSPARPLRGFSVPPEVPVFTSVDSTITYE